MSTDPVLPQTTPTHGIEAVLVHCGGGYAAQWLGWTYQSVVLGPVLVLRRPAPYPKLLLRQLHDLLPPWRAPKSAPA